MRRLSLRTDSAIDVGGVVDSILFSLLLPRKQAQVRVRQLIRSRSCRSRGGSLKGAAQRLLRGERVVAAHLLVDKAADADEGVGGRPRGPPQHSAREKAAESMAAEAMAAARAMLGGARYLAALK